MERVSNIYVLDIDGTLMRTHEIDNACYWQAVAEVFELEQPCRTLKGFRHVSDSGILDQWCREALGRGPTKSEIQALKVLFLQFLETIAAQQPELFQPRPGLEDWLTNMSQAPGKRLAIATGSWHATASFKLDCSGLSRFPLPLATSDDAVSRTDIMRSALRRLDLDEPLAPSRITYVGDGPWDVQAARALGWNFIGIAAGGRARSLRDLGADRVHRDFRPLVNGMT